MNIAKTRNNNMVGVDHISTTKFAFGVTFQSHKARAENF
jgi:hypothetical protein